MLDGVITVKAFGEIKNCLGNRDLSIKCDGSISAHEVLVLLCKLSPDFSEYLQDSGGNALLLMVNQNLITHDTILTSGDEMVIATAPAGG